MHRQPAGRIVLSILVFGLLAFVVSSFNFACSSTTASPRPIAAFSASPTSGAPPLVVQFTDRSIGTVTSWRWNFGDGSNDTAQNPSHAYVNPGYYTVALEVKGPGGRDTTSRSTCVVVMRTSEQAQHEMNSAKEAIEKCMWDAGASQLDSAVEGWDGSAGMVTAGESMTDAADYLDGQVFKAVYDVDEYGNIIHGTDISWGGIVWDDSSAWWQPAT